MTYDDENGLFPLRVARVRSNGKREYDPQSKDRLIRLCREGKEPMSSLARKAQVNASQLRRWVQSQDGRASRQGGLPAFIPVATAALAAVPSSPRSQATLSATLANGVTLELRGGEHGVELARVMLEALGRP